MIACRTCHFCRVYETHGDCRRAPPRVMGEVINLATAPNELLWAVWPQVNLDSDWCGEWKPQTLSNVEEKT